MSNTSSPYKVIIAYTHVDLFASVDDAERAINALNRSTVTRFGQLIYSHCLISVVTRVGLDALYDSVSSSPIFIALFSNENFIRFSRRHR